MAFIRNNNLHQEMQLPDLPNDMIIAILAALAKEKKGWESVMPVFLANKYLYSLFQEEGLLSRIQVNLSTSMPKFEEGPNSVPLTKLSHVLMVNYLGRFKKFPSMKALLDKNQLTSDDPELYSQHNLTLVAAKNNRLNIAIAENQQINGDNQDRINDHQEKIDSIATKNFLFFFGLFTMYVIYSKIMTMVNEQHTNNTGNSIELWLFLIALLPKILTEFFRIPTPVKSLIDEMKLKIDENNNELKKIKAEDEVKLRKKNFDISFEHIFSVNNYNMLFRVNRALKLNDDQDIDKILNTRCPEEMEYSSCSIL